MSARPWTDEEIGFLQDCREWTAAQLAEELGRTEKAIQGARRRLKVGSLGLGKPAFKPFHVGPRPLVAKTCGTCGLLLAGAWFTYNKHSGGRSKWSSSCRSCASNRSAHRNAAKPADHAAANSKHREKYQAITVERATRSHEPYTDADYDVLADQNLTDFQKALRLSRTYRAVANARLMAGLKSKPDGLGDPERDVWVIDNPNVPVPA